MNPSEDLRQFDRCPGLLDMRAPQLLSGMTVAMAYSGGPDAAALAATLKDQGATVIPAYVNYRNKGHSMTKREIAHAIESADLLGLDLTHLEHPFEKRITGEMKSRRNRIILRLLADHFDGEEVPLIGLGTFKKEIPRSRSANGRNTRDLDPKILAKVLTTRSKYLVTWDSFDIDTKADEFRALNKRDWAAMFATSSCVGYRGGALECGECWSCKDRRESFLEVFGKDPTVYKEGSPLASE